MKKEFDIDKQIKSIEGEIAEYTQKLFEAQGMLRLARHIKENCILTPIPEEGKLAPISPA